MIQATVDRAATAAFPKLKRLVALRASSDWTLLVGLDQNREIRLVSGRRLHVEGTGNEIGVRSESEVRVLCLNPLCEPVVMHERSLVDMVDLVLYLSSPLHPLAPGVRSGAMPGLWIPSPGRKWRTHMTAGLFTNAAERFVLGARNGVVTPTAEPVSDTESTPFGLTLRTTPAPRNVVRVRSADGVLTMGTDKVTLIESDGSGDASDVDTDYATD